MMLFLADPTYPPVPAILSSTTFTILAYSPSMFIPIAVSTSLIANKLIFNKWREGLGGKVRAIVTGAAACQVRLLRIFTSAKIAHLNLLPQGQAERFKRVEAMIETMDEHFGSCTNHGECEAACPKEISIDVIALANADYRKAKIKNRKQLARS